MTARTSIFWPLTWRWKTTVFFLVPLIFLCEGEKNPREARFFSTLTNSMHGCREGTKLCDVACAWFELGLAALFGLGVRCICLSTFSASRNAGAITEKDQYLLGPKPNETDFRDSKERWRIARPNIPLSSSDFSLARIRTRTLAPAVYCS